MIISVDEYKKLRELYDYDDCQVKFTIQKVEELDDKYCKTWHGIYAKQPVNNVDDSLTLSGLEKLVSAVFDSCYKASITKHVQMHKHIENLKEVSSAIVHWKMASQGGRAERCANNMINKWDSETHIKLLKGYQSKRIEDFCIGGVRIPTASAFLRFLYPDEFGIIDSRVVRHTQRGGITTLSIRKDGYINDTGLNKRKYHQEYCIFLKNESNCVNDLGVRFLWPCQNGLNEKHIFRPADIEMALFNWPRKI